MIFFLSWARQEQAEFEAPDEAKYMCLWAACSADITATGSAQASGEAGAVQWLRHSDSVNPVCAGKPFGNEYLIQK